jgi:CspA family cold shock protein
MPTGTVKWFNTEKGFGFIRPDECGSDIFFCIDAVQAAELSGLRQALKVTYQIARKRNDEAAINLKLTDLHATPRPISTVRFSVHDDLALFLREQHGPSIAVKECQEHNLLPYASNPLIAKTDGAGPTCEPIT